MTPFLPTSLGSGLELRLDQRDEGPRRRGSRLERGQDLEHGDERDVHRDDARRVRGGRPDEVAGVLLDGHDPGILAEPPVELFRVHVHGVNPCGARV